MHGYRSVTLYSNFTIFLFPDTFWVTLYPLQQKNGGRKLAPKGLGAWACLLGKNGAFLETLETTLSGHHLGVGNPSVCSQGMPCQVLWSGMLGLGRGGQRQLRF